MKVDVGQTYRMRDGGYAIVESEHVQEPVYRFSGRCFDKDGNYDRLAFWTVDGRYETAHQTPFDLSEVADVALFGLAANPRRSEVGAPAEEADGPGPG